MFSFLNFLLGKKSTKYKSNQSSDNATIEQSPSTAPSVQAKVAANLQHLKNETFSAAPDLVIREFMITTDQTPAAIAYLGCMADRAMVQEHILHELLQLQTSTDFNIRGVSIGEFFTTANWDEIAHAIMTGDCALWIEGHAEAYLFSTKGWPQRAIEDTRVETSVRGAHQGFIETGSLNIAMIRRYLPDQALKIKNIIVGSRGQSSISIMYLDDLADPQVLQGLQDRINRINVDAILNTGELAELIEDHPYSPFPQFLLTERPDNAASHLLKGKYIIIVDRSPSVIVAPADFVSFFQSVDDYSNRWLIATFIRILRFMALLISLLLPAVYIALISFNYEVIPIQLILSIAETRSRVPFPPIMEAILMEIMIEMMREAGIRLPAPIGQTIGIVGGIVIGQAAVQAGIVSNIMVIVVASTAIASFIIPNYDMGAAIRMLRFPMMLLAFMFGIVGIICGTIALIGHFVALESLGSPYGKPLAPWEFARMKDMFIRFPLWTIFNNTKEGPSKQASSPKENSRKDLL